MLTARRLSAVGRWKTPLLLGAIACSTALAGCSETTSSISAASLSHAVKPGTSRRHAYHYTSKDRECLQRAMFFESRRSSRDGMIAVGTVVMNRLKSGDHGASICAVVGERGQFAPGVLTRRMNSSAMPDVEEAAEAVLKGERAPKLKNAMHFHTAGLKFPYKNMHYVEVAGGNAFYEKRGRNWHPLPDDSQFAVASAAPTTIETPAEQKVLMASAANAPVRDGDLRRKHQAHAGRRSGRGALPARSRAVRRRADGCLRHGRCIGGR